MLGMRAVPVLPATTTSLRPHVGGKFLYAGAQKLYLRGVTYGTFRPELDGEEYRYDTTVRDFEMMAANGINAIRTYTVPPCWFLDTAQQHGLRVMVGLPWEQHITFLDDRRRARAIEERVRTGVRLCVDHPAVLAYTVGNEIPASIVRWYGHRRIERFLNHLYLAVKDEDPDGLVTYVNYPTTEYLDLSFVDFLTFNVYLKSPDRLAAYLARLQNIANDKPLVMAEIGLDSRRHGLYEQARALAWQVRTAFAAGCAGAFVFAWTDEWHRGGYDIDDWDFGLTDRQRCPKPALEAVRTAFRDMPFSSVLPWPRISVVVCSCNGARTIRDCLDGLQQVNYPDFEVIVVDDGSTDGTGDIARRYNSVRVIRTENCGLSSARNTGMAAASGRIVVYIDDDTRPDPDWLTYLAATFLQTDHVGVGGPNIAPPGDGLIAECVAKAPGGPIHVLLDDELAEHIPGCNMAFRKDALEAIGGFDPQFRSAGDDVDICWRLQERGWTLGFSPAAMVWHHRRNSVRSYWKQQIGYGAAEALLERKWPQKYNSWGHVSWSGRIYSNSLAKALRLRGDRIYGGVWGSAPFQRLYQPIDSTIISLLLMPEWLLLIGLLTTLSMLGVLWTPLLLALPLLVFSSGMVLLRASLSARSVFLHSVYGSRYQQLKRWTLLVYLHLLQPLARLRGRLRFGLVPWRRRSMAGVAVPWRRTLALWSEAWRTPEVWLSVLQDALQHCGAICLPAGDYDQWDLEVRGGLGAAVRLRMAIEEHGGGRQLIRLRYWPRYSYAGILVFVLWLILSIAALFDHAWIASALLGVGAASLAMLVALGCAHGVATVQKAIGEFTSGATW
jgi:GT2 family glycosyltransferase